MSLKIRMSRGGTKKRPFYRIVVADSRKPRDGRYIERVGSYNPMLPNEHPDRVVLKTDRIRHWLDQGARPSDRVAKFLGRAEIIPMPAQRNNPKQSLPRPKTVARMKAAEEAGKAAEEAGKAAEEARKAAEEARKAAAEAAPAEAPPAEDAPTEDTPAADTPAAAEATEEPVAEAAPEEPPAEDAPAEDTPAAAEAAAEPAAEAAGEAAAQSAAEEVAPEQPPAEEAPAGDAPADGRSAEGGEDGRSDGEGKSD